MKIAKIYISNILGIEERELVPSGKLNLIKGKNARGKSSVIKSLQAALSGQSVKEATLLRNGATEGEVVLELTDGTVINKRITSEGSKLSIKGEQKPAAYLKGIIDSVAFNPVQFLLESDENRLKILLENLRVSVTGAQFKQAAPMVEIDDEEELNLSKFFQRRDWVYEERRATNRILKEKLASYNQMLLTAPDESALQELDENVLIDLQNQKAEIDSKKDSIFLKLANEKQAEIDAINAKYEAMREDVVKSYNDKVTPIIQQIADTQSKLQNIGALKQQIAFLAQMKQDVDAYQERYAELDAAIDNVIELYKTMFKDLPINGLTVDNGIIYIDGVQFQHQNTARQLQFMMQLAQLRMGELKVMVVDGIEVLDSGKRNALMAAIQEKNIQVFLTQVTDDDSLTFEN